MYIKQKDSYHKNFLYTIRDSDAHFILQGALKIMIQNRLVLLIFIKSYAIKRR